MEGERARLSAFRSPPLHIIITHRRSASILSVALACASPVLLSTTRVGRPDQSRRSVCCAYVCCVRAALEREREDEETLALLRPSSSPQGRAPSSQTCARVLSVCDGTEESVCEWRPLRASPRVDARPAAPLPRPVERRCSPAPNAPPRPGLLSPAAFSLLSPRGATRLFNKQRLFRGGDDFKKHRQNLIPSPLPPPSKTHPPRAARTARRPARAARRARRHGSSRSASLR